MADYGSLGMQRTVWLLGEYSKHLPDTWRDLATHPVTDPANLFTARGSCPQSGFLTTARASSANFLFQGRKQRPSELDSQKHSQSCVCLDRTNFKQWGCWSDGSLGKSACRSRRGPQLWATGTYPNSSCRELAPGLCERCTRAAFRHTLPHPTKRERKTNCYFNIIQISQMLEGWKWRI